MLTIKSLNQQLTRHEEIDYALMVTLEVAPGVQLPIYQQVSERIAQQIPVRVDGIV